MATNRTRSNKRMQDVTPLFSRKKVFIPAVPYGMPFVGYGSSETTTVSLYSIGDQKKKLTNVGNFHVIAPQLAAQNDEHCLWWKVPDDFYSGGNTYVWLVWTPVETTASGYKNSYQVFYNASKVMDYAQVGTGTSEIIAEAATGLTDEISTTVAMTSLTKYHAYRSHRGRIGPGLVDTEDMVTFKIEAPSNPSNIGTIAVLGIEIDYELRIRESMIELYE
jgi:hypothetical protein